MAKTPRVGDIIRVSDRMQKRYSYVIEARPGRDFASGFTPFRTSKEMLALGVFDGKYCNDCRRELPDSWFKGAKIAKIADPSLNCFAVKSRQPLSVWRDKGWIIDPDPRGWFQWYCRYWLGGRLPEVDAQQIKRWRAFARHAAQVRKQASAAMFFVARASAKLCCNGHTTPTFDRRRMTPAFSLIRSG